MWWINIATVKNVKDDLQEIRFKQELLLSKDNFNNPAKFEGLESLAQEIQNLLIYEKGTFPNHPNLGVGISNYLFEILDERTLSDIRKNIDEQINTFIDHPYITIITNVKKVDKNSKSKSRYTIIDITFTIRNLVTDTSVDIDFLYTGNPKNKKVVSKIYFTE